MIEVRTQAQLDKALKKTNGGVDDLIVIVGDGRFVITEGSPTMEAWGSSAPRMEAWGSSAPRMVARESSAPRMEARGSSAPTMEAWGSSAPRMQAWESSAPTMEAWGSSAPTMEAWGSSAPRMEAWESSAPTMEARGSSAPTMEAWGSSAPRMEAWGSSAVTGKASRFSQPRFWRHDSAKINVPGAVILEAPRLETGADWCEFYGVEILEYSEVSRHGVGASDPDKTDGEHQPHYAADETGGPDGLPVAILFKALGEGFVSSRGMTYKPGSTPEAPDWDGGKEECGGGLHFSPHPRMAEEFNREPAHFVACPVLVSEIAVHPEGSMPQKVKAPRVCAPCWEVDVNGERVEEKAAA